MTGDVPRIPVRTRERSHRSIDERLAVRFPRLARRLLALWQRLPPGSRLRRAALARTLGNGQGAYNRRDFEAGLWSRSPDLEVVTPRKLQEVGFERTYRGHRGYVEFHSRWVKDWGNFRGKLREAADLGDRVLLLADMDLTAASSGIPLENQFAILWEFEKGQVIREQVFFDWGEAERAAGLTANGA
jgi:hypothetical protein